MLEQIEAKLEFLYSMNNGELLAFPSYVVFNYKYQFRLRVLPQEVSSVFQGKNLLLI